MTKRLVFSIGLLGAAAPVLAQGGAEAQQLRRELRAMESLLDQTVEQVSRPNAGFVLAGAPSSRGYLLRGQGVVFVLPPRRLPSPPLVVAHTNRGGMVVIRGSASDLSRVEAQVAAFQRDAQQQWYDVERSIIELQAQLLMATGEGPRVWGGGRQGTAASPETPVAFSGQESGAATGATAGTPRPATPPAPMAPPAPAPPYPIETPIPTGAPESLGFPPEPSAFPVQLPAPPWAFWHENLFEEAEARSPDRVVEDTRDALVQLLESHGYLLTCVSPDETVSVVVDFVAGTPFLDARPARSLSLRVRKRDLDERRAGRIGSDELRRRMETSQY